MLAMPRLYNLNVYKPLRRKLRRDATPAERVLWRYLKGRQFYGLLFHRQHGVGSYIVDFYCPQVRLVVEVDGSIHEDHNVKLNDQMRQKFLESCYLRVVRFTNDEVLYDIDSVLIRLKDAATSPSATPSPPPAPPSF